MNKPHSNDGQAQDSVGTVIAAVINAVWEGVTR